jgi:thiamine-phosphate diphosphorylase
LRTFASILGRPELAPPLLYGISARDTFPGLELFRYLELLFKTQAHVLQWREKDLPEDVARGCIRKGVALARNTGKVFIVNSFVPLALEEAAHGVHLTSKQEIAIALSLRGENSSGFLIGKSVHSLEEARKAESEGADYILLSPIFAPFSKRSVQTPLGIEVLQEVTSLLRIPVFALGGVDPGHLQMVHQAGAAGVAGISWLRQEAEALQALFG